MHPLDRWKARAGSYQKVGCESKKSRFKATLKLWNLLVVSGKSFPLRIAERLKYCPEFLLKRMSFKNQEILIKKSHQSCLALASSSFSATRAGSI